ncbi:MAG: hypothetical protein ACI4F5_00735 [Acutalibacteraceae bacterium]
MLEKSNYRHNKKVGLENDKVINGQGCGKVARMKYGFFNTSYNGCEMIALHNSMVLTNRRSDLSEVCLEMYPKCQSLSGLLGSVPYLLGSFYKTRNIPYKYTVSYNKFFDMLPHYDVAVLSFWNPKKPFNGLHTVAVKYIDGKIRVYNRSNGRSYPVEYSSRGELMPDKTDFICGYLINE